MFLKIKFLIALFLLVIEKVNIMEFKESKVIVVGRIKTNLIVFYVLVLSISLPTKLKKKKKMDAKSRK